MHGSAWRSGCTGFDRKPEDVVDCPRVCIYIYIYIYILMFCIFSPKIVLCGRTGSVKQQIEP